MIRDFINDPAWCETYLEKTAGVERDQLMSVPEHLFGGIFVDDNLHKHFFFPMNTPENLEKSAGYLLFGDPGLTREAKAYVASRLTGGYAYYGQEPPMELNKIASKEAPKYFLMRKAAAPQIVVSPVPEDSYALYVDGHGRYPIRDEKEAKTAAAYFEEHWQEFPPHTRRAVAQAFQKKASSFGVEVGEQAKRYLGEERSFLFKSAMLGRASLVEDLKDLYTALIEDTSPLEEQAQMLAELDKTAGMEGMWDNTLTDPWATVYDNTRKVPEEGYKYSVGGFDIDGTDLIRLAERNSKHVEDVLGVNYARKFLDNPIEAFEKAGAHLKRVLVNMAVETKIEAR